MIDKLNLENVRRELSDVGNKMSDAAKQAADAVSDIWDDFEISDADKDTFHEAQVNAEDAWNEGTVEVKREAITLADRIKNALSQIEQKIGCFPGSQHPGVVFPSETDNGYSFSNQFYELHKEEILLELYKELLEVPDGTYISTSQLLSKVRPDLLSLFGQSTLFEIHSDLLGNAGKYGLLLDMSSHDGLIEGLPFNLRFEVKHIGPSITITEDDILQVIVRSSLPEQIINCSFIDMLADVDNVESRSLSETVCVSSYLAACKYSISDAVTAVSDNVSKMDIDEKVQHGLRELYSSPEYLKKIAEENGITIDDAKKTLDEFVDISMNAGKATAYLSARLAAGSLRAIENPLKVVCSTVASATGNPEKASEILQTSKIDEFVDMVNDEFNESDTVEAIGDTVDKFGEIAGEIALTVLVFKGIPVGSTAVAASAATHVTLSEVAGTAALAALSLGAAEKDLEENAGKTGELTAKEYLSAYTVAAATAVSNVAMVGVTNKLISMAPKAAAALYKATELTSEVGGKVTGTLMSAAIASSDAGIMKAADEIKKITHVALGLEDSFDVKQEVKEFIETVGVAAAFSGVGYYGLNTIKHSAAFKAIAEKLTGKEFIPQMDYFEQAYAEAEEFFKEVQAYATAYAEEIINNSEVPETLKDLALDAKELKKVSPEEVAELRSYFDKNRDALRKSWEELYGMEWPTYDHDIVSANGYVIRKAGDPYDAHHKIPLSMGGTNDVTNITPLSADVHYDWQGVHSSSGPYQKLMKLLERAV